MIERLAAKQGEFGVVLLRAVNWADWQQTQKSYELYARFVMPKLAGVNRHRQASYDRLYEDFGRADAERQKGVDLAFAKLRQREGKD